VSAAPVNLNRVRKAKARAKAAAKANENVVKHGRSKAQKELEKARADKHIHALEQHKTEP
jgi:hypothetical protein